MAKTMSEGQRAYEQKRAARAGMTLEKWLEAKEKQAQEEAREQERAAKAAARATRKPGLLSRLLDRAHKPL